MIVLLPTEEAALIAYIVSFSFLCDVNTCKKRIADIIRQHGKLITRIVYRGHSKKDPRITSRTPFFSVSPDKGLALLFLEHTIEEGHIGNLFKLHLKRVPTLDTHDIKYTFSKEVVDELRTLVKQIPIQEGIDEKKYNTIEEYLPKLKKTLRDLLDGGDGTELLILNGGRFYTDASMTEEGDITTNHSKGYTLHEAWYSFL